jgi:membrane dipeptidase
MTTDRPLAERTERVPTDRLPERPSDPFSEPSNQRPTEPVTDPATGLPIGPAAVDAAQRAAAEALHRDAIVVDALDVSVMDRRHLEHMRDGGVTAANYTITLGDGFGFHETVERILAIDDVLAANADIARNVRSVADIRVAKADGVVGLIYGFQNSTPFEGDERLVRVVAALGVRIVQLAYMTANLLADGCLESRNAGLTEFGRAVTRELNRARILIDLSHVGDRSTLEAIDASADPVAFTHANARELSPSPRNKTYEAIRSLAARGGVMGFSSLPSFVSEDPRDATLDRYLDHIDHVVQMVGIEHVGLGLDFVEGHVPGSLQPRAPKWGGANLPAGAEGLARMLPERLRAEASTLLYLPYAEGIRGSEELPNVTEGLLRRGYGEDDVRAIIGGNWLRLFEQIWGQ